MAERGEENDLGLGTAGLGVLGRCMAWQGRGPLMTKWERYFADVAAWRASLTPEEREAPWSRSVWGSR